MPLTFVNLPTSAHGYRQGRPPIYMTREVQAELQANPGEWALLLAGTDANRAKTVAQWCYRHEGFEVSRRVRADGDGFDVFVRWVDTPDA
jgi:hypothetical protein